MKYLLRKPKGNFRKQIYRAETRNIKEEGTKKKLQKTAKLKQQTERRGNNEHKEQPNNKDKVAEVLKHQQSP